MQYVRNGGKLDLSYIGILCIFNFTLIQNVQKLSLF